MVTHKSEDPKENLNDQDMKEIGRYIKDDRMDNFCRTGMHGHLRGIKRKKIYLSGYLNLRLGLVKK